MRQQGSTGRRPRGRSNRKQHLSPRSQTFDSNGPDIRVRGNAHQVYEKYLALARDATASGDRIAAEGYYQFAEHYYRVVNDSTDPQRSPEPNRGPGYQPYGDQPRDGEPYGEAGRQRHQAQGNGRFGNEDAPGDAAADSAAGEGPQSRWSGDDGDRARRESAGEPEADPDEDVNSLPRELMKPRRRGPARPRRAEAPADDDDADNQEADA